MPTPDTALRTRWAKTALVSFVCLFVLRGVAPASTEGAPAFAIRGTLPWHNFLSGPTAWNEEDYERYLDRLAELGLNFVGFHCYTGGAERYAPYVEPMIRITYRDVVPQATDRPAGGPHQGPVRNVRRPRPLAGRARHLELA